MFAHRSAARLAGLVTIACLGACGGATPADAVAPTVAGPDAAATAPSAAVADAGPTIAPDVVGFGKIDDPGVALCALPSESVRGTVAPLRTKPGGAPVAWLDGHDAKIAFAPVNGNYFLDVTTGAAHARGYAAPSEITLRLRRAVAMGGYFVPTSSGRVTATAAKDGTVTAVGESITGVTFVATPTADVACGDLTLATIDFDVASVVPASTPPLRFVRLLDRDVALGVDANGPAVARIRRAETRVKVLTVSGARTRIAATFDDATIFGWVATSDVGRDHPDPEPQIALLQALGNGPATRDILGGGPAAPGVSAPPNVIDQLRCPSEMRLAVDVGGERTFVATVAPSIVQVVSREDLFARVHFLNAERGALVAASGASFVVPARDLAACASIPITHDPPPRIPGPTPPGPARNDPDPDPGPRGVASLSSVAMTTPIADGERALRARVPRARACYNVGLKADPSQRGTVKVALAVAANGDVRSATILANSGLSASAAACVGDAFKRTAFDPPGGAGSTVTVTIVFTLQTP